MENIAVDIRFLHTEMQKGHVTSGVGQFCLEILNGFVQNKAEKKVFLLVSPAQKKYCSKRLPQYITIDCNPVGGKYGFHWPFHVLTAKKTARTLNNNHINIIWFPFANPLYFLDMNVYTVSTIHDLIPIHDNENKSRIKNAYKNILRKSDQTVTISNFVERDIRKTLQVSDDQYIAVVPNPISMDDRFEAIPELDGKKYILDVNAYQVRKNAITLIKAFDLIKEKIDYDLVFCGGYDENGTLDRLKSEVKKRSLDKRVHFYCAISSEKRNWLIKKAELFVSPTLSEGFGRTPVEAAMYCVPVLTSETEPLKDVTLGLLNYYHNAKDEKELAKAIIAIINAKKSKDKLHQISQALCKEYAIEPITLKYIEIFQNISFGAD